jgi:hypothetical protein
MIENVMLKDSIMSSSIGGIGMIMTTRMHITASPINRSTFLAIAGKPGMKYPEFTFSIAASCSH